MALKVVPVAIRKCFTEALQQPLHLHKISEAFLHVRYDLVGTPIPATLGCQRPTPPDRAKLIVLPSKDPPGDLFARSASNALLLHKYSAVPPKAH